MEYIRNNENITLLCEGALTSTNAEDLQKEIFIEKANSKIMLINI